MLSYKKMFFTFIVLLSSLVILAACGSNGGDEEEVTDNGDEATNESGNNEDYAHATWNGEELQFNSTTCGHQPGSGYNLTAFGDGYHLQASYKVSDDNEDMLDPEFDFSEVFGVELFFSAGPDSTIGEGEGYENDGPLTDVTGDELSAKGTATLKPDSTSRAEEINPEGGEIEFEIQCSE